MKDSESSKRKKMTTVRDHTGRSLAEASATLFRDILIGRKEDRPKKNCKSCVVKPERTSRVRIKEDLPLRYNEDHPPPHRHHHHSKSGFLSLRHDYYCESGKLSNYSSSSSLNRCLSCPSTRRKPRLRRNSSLSSIWNSWEDYVNRERKKEEERKRQSFSGKIYSEHSVICGVPGIGVSMRRDRNDPGTPSRPKSAVLSDVWAAKTHRVTFNLPRLSGSSSLHPSKEDESCCCCCCCCCCCYDEDEFIQKRHQNNSTKIGAPRPIWDREPLPTPPPPRLPPKKYRAEHSDHYQTPHDRDGDYSYAYDSSVSPAFLIKWNEYEDDYYSDEHLHHHHRRRKENLYEEIVDVREQMKKFTENEKSNNLHHNQEGGSAVESNSDSGIGNLQFLSSSETEKSQRSMRFSQGTLDISTSKKDPSSGKKKITRRPLQRTSSFSSSTSTRDDEAFNDNSSSSKHISRHQRVLNQLRLDVEDLKSQSRSSSPEKPEPAKAESEQPKSNNRFKGLNGMLKKVTRKNGLFRS